MTGGEEDLRDDGFNRLELLVVLMIIGAAIAIPTYLSQQQEGRRTQAASDLKIVAKVLESLAADHARQLRLGRVDAEQRAASAGQSLSS